MRGPGPGYEAWLLALGRPGAPTRGSIAAGDRLAIDEIRLDVRWPVRGTVPEEPPDDGTGINNVSVVLLGVVGDRRFLLTGDVEDGVDPALLAAGLPRVDVLKVAHHGSRTATTDAFVTAVRPRVAIASAGTGNPYGHPARTTLERLAASGARVYRTDRDGTVTVTFDAAGPVVRREPRQAAARPVPARAATAVTSRRFFCAIPGFGAPVAAALPVEAQAPSARGVDGHGTSGRSRSVGYHRPDDGPHPDRGGCPADLPGSPTLVPRARGRRGRGGWLAVGPDGGQRGRRGPTRRSYGRAGAEPPTRSPPRPRRPP